MLSAAVAGLTGVPVRLEMLVGVLHHVLDGVLPPVTDPAEELQAGGQPQSILLNPGPMADQVLQHHRSVREQNVETAQLAVDPEIDRQNIRENNEIF